VSVRPFEPGWLKERGFFLSNDPKVLAWSKSLKVELAKKQLAIFANEGRLDVTTKDGLRYSLLFGEVAPEDTADTSAEKAKKDPAKPADPEKAGANRYLSVFVTYDPAIDEDAKKDESKAKKDEAKPEEKKKKSGKERAAKAQTRYQQFFYVIKDTSFKTLRPELAKLFEDLPPEPMAGTTGKTNVQWLADHGKEPGVTTTASGLQYQVLSKGAPGGKRPTATSKVKVNYKGTKVDGTVFDESAKHGGPAEFQLGQVVQGWNEGIPLMQVGDKYTFWIPPAIGYGGKDKNPPATIGPDQILIFEVELLDVLTNPAAEAAPPSAAPAPPAAAAPTPAAPAPAPAAPAPAP
jgi:FKBP-type peptidyl-prolyl cis-trans isomerase